MALVLFLLCLTPLFLADIMQAALEKLDLSPPVALSAVIAIFVGSLVNIPVYRIARHQEQLVDSMAVFGLWGWTPQFQRVRRDTIIAINVGGCVIPMLLAAWQVSHLLRGESWPLLALGLATIANVTACYWVARPVSGVGITMPGLTSPLVAVGLTWLLLISPEYDPIRAPVAFIAGVLGPLVGADLLHLQDINKVSAGVLSIGGAGTFDGIVLSGILAALLA
jgi:uncharacterized membrane protein